MESFNRFSRLTVGVTLALTLVIACVMAVFDPAAAKGFALGGMAGAAGFWHMANCARKFATISPVELPYRIYRWTFMRMGLYGVALVLAYTVDRQEYHGLIAAVFGLLAVRVVMTALGLTIARVKAEKNANSG